MFTIFSTLVFATAKLVFVCAARILFAAESLRMAKTYQVSQELGMYFRGAIDTPVWTSGDLCSALGFKARVGSSPACCVAMQWINQIHLW